MLLTDGDSLTDVTYPVTCDCSNINVGRVDDCVVELQSEHTKLLFKSDCATHNNYKPIHLPSQLFESPVQLDFETLDQVTTGKLQTLIGIAQSKVTVPDVH